jgi:hypothetical protein
MSAVGPIWVDILTIAVRAARAARLGPKHIDMLAPNTPDADPSPHTID